MSTETGVQPWHGAQLRHPDGRVAECRELKTFVGRNGALCMRTEDDPAVALDGRIVSEWRSFPRRFGWTFGGPTEVRAGFHALVDVANKRALDIGNDRRTSEAFDHSFRTDFIPSHAAMAEFSTSGRVDAFFAWLRGPVQLWTDRDIGSDAPWIDNDDPMFGTVREGWTVEELWMLPDVTP